MEKIITIIGLMMIPTLIISYIFIWDDIKNLIEKIKKKKRIYDIKKIKNTEPEIIIEKIFHYFDNKESFPEKGIDNNLYISYESNKIYVWTNGHYELIQYDIYKSIRNNKETIIRIKI